MQQTKIRRLLCVNLRASTISTCLVLILGFFLAPSGNVQAGIVNNCVNNTSPSDSCAGSQWQIGVSQVITVPFGVTVTASGGQDGVQAFSPAPGPSLIVEGSIRVISGAGSGIENSAVMTSIVNSGTIISSDPSTTGIKNKAFTGSIGTITNRGTIQGGQYGVWNEGFNPALATIDTLTNTGTISGGTRGIKNDGIIGELNNLSSSLSLQSNLPVVYNVIIDSAASYGKLTTTLLNNGSVMTFGISSLSTTNSSIINTTLYSVLSGVVPSPAVGNNPEIIRVLNTSGISNGYTFVLSETSSGSGIWNLLITACSVCVSSDSGSSSGGTSISNISSGASIGLASIGASPVLSGGTLVLLSGDSSSTAFSVTSASTIQNPTTGSATLSGVFSGTGSLTFTGTGTTIFTGTNTYSSGTTVASGTLSVAGSSPTGTGDVYVASAGTLMGTGTISGNLSVGGVLKPGNSPGYLVASSKVSMNTGSTYQQDIAGLVQASSATPVGATGYYSLLSVGGQFTIHSGATLTPRLANLFSANESGYGSAIYVPALGDRFRMVTATGGISGRFSTLTQPAELATGTQFVAFYNVNSSNSLDLAVTPISYSTTLSTSTTNAKAVASVLDQLLGVNKTGTASAAQDSLLDAVAGQTAASLPGFAQALSGEIHAASAATLPQATQRVQQAVLARLGDFPMPPTQLNGGASNLLSSGAITGNNPSGLPTANMSSNPAVNPNSANITSAAIADGRAWGEIAYQRGERSGNGGGNGYHHNLYQAVFGVDAYTNAALGLKLGGGLALSNTTVVATGGGSTIQQGALFLYGKMPVAQDYVLDSMVSLGLSSTKLSRTDITGLSSGFNNKSVMGHDALVSIGLSRPFETSDVRVTPYARLTYQYVGQAAYDEGSSTAALSVARLSSNGVRLRLRWGLCRG